MSILTRGLVYLGVKRWLLRRQIKHLDYRKAILQGKNKFVNFLNIQSKNHKVSTFKSQKLGISSFYDKRFVLGSHSNIT